MHLRRIALLTLALAIAAVIQSVLGRNLTVFGARPDLVLLLVVTHSVARGIEEGLLAGLVGGLMIEMFSVVPFGASILGLGLIGFATGLGQSNIYRANFLVPLVAVFLATIFYHSFIMLALQGVGWNVEWISTLALQTVPGAVFNSLLAPLAFPIVRRLASQEQAESSYRW